MKYIMIIKIKYNFVMEIMIIFDLYTYFNLLGELSCRIDNKNDAEPYRKVYYSLSGKPF